MTFEVKIKILICAMLVALGMLLGLMWYAVDSHHEDLKSIDLLMDEVEKELERRQI